jgi:glyoxylase-like metal-dependent hydrolase (beta-lactamase superfamily II)
MGDAAAVSLGHDLYLIDAFMHDEPERLACYLFDTPRRLLIECGPSRSIGHLFRALDSLGVDDVATLAVTHIHLDHAGGAGHLAQRFPGADIAVHTSGVPHLADPGRLWESATQIYGEQGMQDLWGPMEPIRPDRLSALEEGDHIPLGGGRSVEVLYTPGHAKHHVVFTEAETGACFVGDAAGIAFPQGHMVQPVTPPPDFDPEMTVAQLHRIARRRPSFLGFAHFGPHPDPETALAEAEERIELWVGWVRKAAGGGDLAAAMRRWVLDDYRERGIPEDVIEIYDRNTYWPMQAAGILRWLHRRP